MKTGEMSKPVHWKWSWQETQVTMATWWMLCSRKEAREKESRIASSCLSLPHIYFKHGCDSASGSAVEFMSAGASLPVAAFSLLFLKLHQFLRDSWLCGLGVLIIFTVTAFGSAAKNPRRLFALKFSSWKPEWDEWTHTHHRLHHPVHNN